MSRRSEPEFDPDRVLESYELIEPEDGYFEADALDIADVVEGVHVWEEPRPTARHINDATRPGYNRELERAHRIAEEAAWASKSGPVYIKRVGDDEWTYVGEAQGVRIGHDWPKHKVKIARNGSHVPDKHTEG